MKKLFASKYVYVAALVLGLLAGVSVVIAVRNAAYKQGYQQGALAEKAEWAPTVAELDAKLSAVTIIDTETTAEAPLSTTEPKTKTKAAAVCAKVNVNTATTEELEGLPGVGPGMAAKIIAARPLSSDADLDAIPGVGEKVLAKLSECVLYK